MEKNAINNSIIKRLLKIPKKIIEHKSNSALAECILYELSGELCLHLKNVAYFVYNPDFHLCKGIAGISKEDYSSFCDDPWIKIEDFSKIIKSASFNKKVIESSFCTLSHNSIDLIVESIKNSLENKNLIAYTWERTYKNIGILLYEPTTLELKSEDEIESIAGILSFCPIGN